MKEFLKKLVERLRPFYRAWMVFAHFIGRINTAILLTLFYFLFLGIAKVVTLLGRKDLLDTRWKDRSSYWKKRVNFRLGADSFLRPY